MKIGYEAPLIDYKPVGNEGTDLRAPTAHFEQKYLATIKSKASTPAEIKQRSKDAKRLTELAMGHRALEAEQKSRFDKFEAFTTKHLRFTE